MGGANLIGKVKNAVAVRASSISQLPVGRLHAGMWRENRLALAVADICSAPVAEVLFPTSFGIQPFIGKIAQLWDRITYELTH